METKREELRNKRLASNPPEAPDDERLIHEVLRLNGIILGLVLGIVGAIGIFVATNWLVIKGGARVGPHLGLLAQFFPGYSVTVLGSFVGAAYCFVGGFAAGWVVAWVYNRVVALKELYRQ